MKNQGIPEHKINFTGEVGQVLDETTNRKQNASNKGADPKKKAPKKIRSLANNILYLFSIFAFRSY